MALGTEYRRCLFVVKLDLTGILDLSVCLSVSLFLYREESEAKAALEGLNGRYYAGKTIVAELSPVTNFREAVCRSYEENECRRGGYCNFMHLRQIGRCVWD